MANSLVSIIIPCHNGEQFVAEAIESALGQTHPDTEVIVIDDGSTDGSLDVIKSFGDRIRWETGPNRGACAARNRGIALAAGDVIQFLDADDVLYPTKLERQLPLLLESQRRLVFCDANRWDEQGVAMPDLVRQQSPHDPVAFMLKDGLPTPGPLHWKHNLTSIGGFREDLPCSQERDLHLRLAATGLEFVRLPEFLYLIRRQPGSVSSDIVKVVSQELSIVSVVYDALIRDGTLTEERARGCAGMLTRDARILWRNREYDLSRLFLQRAREMHPDGGVEIAYGRSTRWVYRIFGVGFTEWLRSFRRRDV